MRRVLRIGLASLFLVMISPGVAAGGGWWTYIDVEKEYLAVDQELSFVTRQALFETIEEARQAEANQGYFAYLVDRKSVV